MSTRTLFALLEELGYRRHEIGRLSRHYVHAVLFHPRHPPRGLQTRGSLDLQADDSSSQQGDFDQAEAIRTLLRSRGQPEWRIAEQEAASLAAQLGIPPGFFEQGALSHGHHPTAVP